MVFTQADLILIDEVKIQGGNIWRNNLLLSIKQKIKKHYVEKNNEQCCYCRRELRDEFNMVIDIEHILPQGHILFVDLMFDLENLNASCKRCNMNIKRGNIGFLTDLNSTMPDYKHSHKYLFIHPNFDDYFSHIDYESTIRNDKKLIKYIPKTNKGKFTYEYFRLKKIEIDSLNIAQGAIFNAEEINSDIGDNIKTELKELLIKI